MMLACNARESNEASCLVVSVGERCSPSNRMVVKRNEEHKLDGCLSPEVGSSVLESRALFRKTPSWEACRMNVCVVSGVPKSSDTFSRKGGGGIPGKTGAGSNAEGAERLCEARLTASVGSLSSSLIRASNIAMSTSRACKRCQQLNWSNALSNL